MVPSSSITTLSSSVFPLFRKPTKRRLSLLFQFKSFNNRYQFGFHFHQLNTPTKWITRLFSYKLFTEITHTFHDEQTLRSFSRTINFDCQLCNPILMNMFSFVIWLIFSLIILCFFCNFFFIAGPAFWGLINPQWNMCTKGRRQSPIDIEPDKLLFDPYLRPLHIDKHKVNAINYMKNGYLIWLKKESIGEKEHS